MSTETTTESYKDEGTLRFLYWEKNRPMTEIADEFGVATDTIRYWMDKFGIERRDKSDAHRLRHARNDAPYKDKESLYTEYVVNGRTSEELANEWECDQTTILNWLDKFGIERRQTGDWQTQGYASYFMSDDSYMRWMDYEKPSRGKSIPVHRLIAVAEWGVDAVKDNHIHHKNGIKWDNRVENLEIVTPSEHAKMHYENGDLELESGGIAEMKNEVER
jgi:transposase-like protein